MPASRSGSCPFPPAWLALGRFSSALACSQSAIGSRAEREAALKSSGSSDIQPRCGGCPSSLSNSSRRTSLVRPVIPAIGTGRRSVTQMLAPALSKPTKLEARSASSLTVAARASSRAVMHPGATGVPSACLPPRAARGGAAQAFQLAPPSVLIHVRNLLLTVCFCYFDF